MNKFNKKLTISLPDDPQYSHGEGIPLVKQPTAEKQSLLQFRDYRDGGESEGGETRQEHASSKMNYVEFEQFHVNKFEPRQSLKTEEQVKKTPKHKRNFTIELPDRDGDKIIDKKRGNPMGEYESVVENSECYKQPPAPPKGSKQNKVFVFPNSPQVIRDDKQDEERFEELKRSFERQRQEFYKEKSKLQKQILIKNGQIDMLQKIVKEKYSFDGQTEKRHYLHGDNLNKIESILLEKDIEINELLQKIGELSDALAKKNEEYSKKLFENSTLEALVESLKNQIYIYEKKQSSDKMTNKFYLLQKERERQRKHSWEDDDLEVGISHIDYGRKGIEQLNRRIQMIKHNRRQLNSRHKVSSQYTPYSQSTKNRPKGAFDFKGKVAEDSKLNKTRIF